MRFIRSSFSPGLQALKRVVQSAFRLLGYELHRIQTDADRYRYYMAQPWVGILKPCDGIDFTPHCQLQFIREILPIYYAEYANLPRNESDNPEGFYLNNGYFGPIDAEVLYTVVRHWRPSLIIEVGSGFSTRLIRLALDVGKISCQLVCIDPEPRASIVGIADRHIAAPVESVSPELFRNLQSNDILFIDSSHQIIPGGDVVYLVCEILPILNPGVLVHFHDIRLPFEYSAFELQHLYTEQYLVQAFLCGNSMFDVLFAGHYLGAYYPGELLARIPGIQEGRMSGSLWLRRKVFSSPATEPGM